MQCRISNISCSKSAAALKSHNFFHHRRIYSFYRVANAVILSFTMVTVVFVIQLEGNRHVNLSQAVTEKIGDFLRSEC